MSVVDMKIIRWMGKVTTEDIIRNEYTGGNLRVALIKDKMRDNGLRLLRYILRENESEAVNTVRKCM